MRWESFCDYVYMRSCDEDDITYRAYDLACKASKPQLRKALIRLGVGCVEPRSVKVLLQNYWEAFKVLSDEQVETYLQEWYVYDRIRLGEVRCWKYRTVAPVNRPNLSKPA